MKRRHVAIVVGTLLILTGARPAAAEWLVDLYAGGAFTENAKLTIEGRTAAGSTRGTQELRVDPSAEFGARIGRWFDSAKWLGIAVDAFHFEPNISAQQASALTDTGLVAGARLQPIDVSVTALALDLMFRVPGILGTSDIPQGRLQPYVTAGAAGFVVEVTDTTNFAPARQSGVGVFPGLKLGGGLAWQFHKNVALFAEYRFTHFHASFEDASFRIASTRAKASGDVDINTHHAVGGLSIRF
jgi:hypothetical protein